MRQSLRPLATLQARDCVNRGSVWKPEAMVAIHEDDVFVEGLRGDGVAVLDFLKVALGCWKEF